MKIRNLAAVALSATLLGGGIASALPTHAANPPRPSVPDWMTRICVAEDSVNCYNPNTVGAGYRKPFFVRQLPGTNRVCVFFVANPGRDYCERRR